VKRNLGFFAVLTVLALPASAFDFGNLGDLGKGAALVGRTVDSVNQANKELTPMQQYYLGRAFGATILESRKPLDNPTVNQYVNYVGQSLVLAADQPATYDGYRFLVVDTPEANAFSGPGGYIFVTKGLIKLTSNEAELAAVLAHEISHVALQHGVKAIQKNRLTGAWVGAGADAAKTFGPSEVKDMTAAFEGSITDLTQAVVNKGYSRDTEFEADAHAVEVLRKSGYSPLALLSMLEDLKKIPQGSGSSLSKTHPAPADRIAKVKPLVQKDSPVTLTDVQKQRYQAALGSL
jgi:predicted Zn-dependent protease